MSSRRRIAFSLLLGPLLGLLPAVPAVAAAEPFVLATFNQAALARHAPLPTAAPADAAGWLRVTADWTSESVVDGDAGESLRLDGEALRLGFTLARARGPWRFSAELPLLATGGGELDAVIENWHSAFGLPNGGRETLPRGDYRYQYQRGAETLLDVDRGHDGLGDLRLGAGYCGETRCLRSMLQLPTGDADQLLGGGLGLAVWAEQSLAFADGWSGMLAAGLSGVRADGPLETMQREFIPFGWASLGYSFTERWALGAQFTLHGALYKDSELDGLSQTGGQLGVGLRYRSATAGEWWLGFQEDPLTESSPDFSIHAAFAWR